MKKICLLFLIFISVGVFAQPLLYNPMNYSVGETNLFMHQDSATLSAQDGGADVTWDFSKLPVADTFVQHIIDPDETFYVAGMPGANICEYYTDSILNFYNSIASGSSIVGFVDSAKALQMFYPNSSALIFLPVTYLQQSDDTFTRLYEMGGIHASGHGYAHTVADGYGTLILRTDTFYNVLRIRYEQFSFDTFDFTVPNDVYTFSWRWFDSLNKAPLLQLDSISVRNAISPREMKVVQYLLQPNKLTSLQNISTIEYFKVFKTGNEVLLKGNFEEGENYTCQIFSADGKLLNKEIFTANQNEKRFSFNGSVLPASMLFVKLNSANGKTASAKLWWSP